MVSGFSVCASLLVSNWNHALVSTSPIGKRIAQLKLLPPGRRMTSVPRKPPHTSVQRNGDTRSLKIVAASSVMTSGAINTMDVNSGSGM